MKVHNILNREKASEYGITITQCKFEKGVYMVEFPKEYVIVWEDDFFKNIYKPTGEMIGQIITDTSVDLCLF